MNITKQCKALIKQIESIQTRSAEFDMHIIQVIASIQRTVTHISGSTGESIARHELKNANAELSRLKRDLNRIPAYLNALKNGKTPKHFGLIFALCTAGLGWLSSKFSERSA